MRKAIISIVSDQTIPNIIFLKNTIYDRNDIFIFITTQGMQEKKKLEHTLNSLKLNRNDYKVLEWIVPYDDVIEIRKIISDEIDNLSNEYGELEWIVNITGGTKLMSLAVYEVFIRKSPNVYYMPLRKDFFYKVFPEKGNMIINIESYLNIDEYLKGYGIEYKRDRIETFYIKKSYKMLDRYKTDKGIFREYSEDIRINLRNSNKKIKNKLKNSIKIEEITESTKINRSTVNFIKDIIEKDEISYADVKFLSGDWLEIYIYNLLNKILPKRMAEVYPSFNIVNFKNEIDGAIIYKNNLYLLECKTFLPDRSRISFMNEVIYKAQAIKTTMGLASKYIVFMLDGDVKDNEISKVTDREKAFNREISVIWGYENLEENVKKVLGIT